MLLFLDPFLKLIGPTDGRVSNKTLLTLMSLTDLDLVYR